MRENYSEKVPATEKLFCYSPCSNPKQRNLNFLQLIFAHAYIKASKIRNIVLIISLIYFTHH